MICLYAQENLESLLIVFVGPCSFAVVLKFDQDIKSNANRAQLDRGLCAAWAVAGLAEECGRLAGQWLRAMVTVPYPCLRTARGTVLDHVVGLQDIHPPGRPVAEHGDRYPQETQTIDGREEKCAIY